MEILTSKPKCYHETVVDGLENATIAEAAVTRHQGRCMLRHYQLMATEGSI